MDDKFIAASMDVEQKSRDRLQSVFPECFADGKLQIDKLLNLCGEYIEDDFEKYEFRWKGKVEAQKLANRRTAGTLLPDKESSADWDATKNIYIEGDNLEVLKLLQTSYFRKVKMIYIDPPYNTGHDFVYEDNFADPIASYKEITSQATKSNPETMGRFHTNWLNMMFPRLRLAANLLRDDGVIFISIDDTEVRNLRYLLDDIFGEENFIGNIAWESKTKSQNTITAFNKLQPKIEHILVYTKHDKRRFNLLEKGKRDYPLEDEQGKYREHVLELMNATGIRGRETMIFDISDGVATVSPPKGKQWQIGQSQVATYKTGNNLFIRDGKVVIKMRPEFERNETTEPFWAFLSKEIGTAESAKKELAGILGNHGFETVKPMELIKRLAFHATENDDTILDFFSGSATTAHAVMQLNAEDGGNRRFICVQLPELCDEKSEAYKAGYKNICEIGKERIRRAGAKIKAENQLTAPNLDTGFRAFKLDTSNLKAWDTSPIREKDPAVAAKILLDRLRAHIDILNPDRSDLDVTFEVMLKFGQDLCEAVTPLNINGKTVYGVCANVKFIVCLAPDVSAEDAEEMAKYAPGRIVFADSCFDNTEQKTNVKLILRDKGITIKSL
ncbi:DNA methylase N-4 [Clostridia bacterium]|nr:DNA methylase N-4 [Clostridia bacterium]